MDFEEKLLSRATVNYLFLGQYETFRASVKTLWRKNPAIATAILEAVIKEVGDIKGISWSKSISSPAHLAWLAFSQILELHASLPLEKRGSLLWGLDTRLLRLQLEAFFLLNQIIKALESKAFLPVSKRTSKVELSSLSSDELQASVDNPDISSLVDNSCQSFQAGNQEYDESTVRQLIRKGLQSLKLIFDAWYAETKLHLVSGNKPYDTDSDRDGLDGETLPLAAEAESLLEKQALQHIVLCEPELLSTLCWLIVEIKRLLQQNNETNKGCPSCILSSVLDRKVQHAFLEILQKNLSSKECLRLLPLLQTEFGVPDETYRDVMYKLVKKTLSQDPGVFKHDSTSVSIFELYKAIQASGCTRLVSTVELAQDSFLHEDRDSDRPPVEPVLPPPLGYLHQCFRHLRQEDNRVQKDDGLNENGIVRYCLRQLFHYSRATGTHMFDTVMDAALSSIKMQHFQKAVDILALFPRLKSLAAVIGWDLLTGNTTARRLMLEFLWPCKSDDSSSYIKEGDQLCCVDYLCDQLCYRLDLAYFSAHINSGLEWRMSSFLYPYGGRGKNSKNLGETKPADAFVANLVLERLAMHSPIRVLFDVVPDVKLKHARALLKMCPVASGVADSMRLQDMEIVELHFGVQAAVLSLGAMEKGMQDGERKGLRVLAMSMLEDLKAHIVSISNKPRRVFLMGLVVDLLLMDDASTPSLLSGLELKLESILESRTEKVGNDDATKITTIDFIRRLLEILRECMFTSLNELDDQKAEFAFPKGYTNLSCQKAWEWKNANIAKFIEDWNWRLAVLQRLAPSPRRVWQWKEALAVLRAAPSTLLNM